MTSVLAIAYFATLFLALAALLRWRYRRQEAFERLRHGLRSYVTMEA